ncbi:MAG: ABC transporter permease [Oscillospiraceae bacterium]|nr:ABC transporter permease [Oscillospiraceae bacterium]
MKKSPSITNKLPALTAGCILLLVWQLVCSAGLVPGYMLPSPLQVLTALWTERAVLWGHTLVTLQEAFAGLGLGVVLGFAFALLMDAFPLLRRAVYPILVVTQTVPTVAIAPLLVLWLGYGLTPKIVLIVLTTFFPVTVGLLDGFGAADPDAVGLLRSMGAGRWQVFRYIKFPGAMSQFFSGLRIATAYCVVGAVISEWLGGFAGLGVYMTRVRKAFAFDKMFAVILLISVISLLLMALVDVLRRLCMPWQKENAD